MLNGSPGVHPFTGLSVAASAWIAVVGLNSPWVSAACVLAAWGWAAAFSTTRSQPWRVPLWGLALSAPVSASMILIHAPHGQRPLAPLLTADGLAVALVLSLRFGALVTAVLAATATFRVADLAKAVQAAGLPASLGYIVGATLRLVPEARVAVDRIREANALAGRSTGGLAVIPRVITPLVTTLMVRAAHSARSLETLGLGNPGPRTLLRPVPDSRPQRVVRWVLPVVAVAAVMGRAAI
ncbi:ABC transporter permease [Corynebacterium sp. zg-331]|uniref:energy-coupling factor transporter transmembrane component T family protein n=1 Tax=unclassified Corynebacterium TaxID=2624378 RepID=UPI00128BC7DA|nr:MULTISPECIES: energy-coupling factor transporter transmembrane component T [unclassified Corynebacterium]MBC3186169.1 ABC transporter permease [Corynebacterium sp. zg-331]MPV52658.1 ABC transporter permease [Corynebacterium sp. zg331]